MNHHSFAVIFDMDGVLLDTEPLWGESMMAVAQSHGIKVSYSELRFTTGLRIHEVTQYWAEKFPWNSRVNAHEVAERILDHIIENSKKNACVMPGILDHLKYLQSQNIPIGLATSSPFRMADTLIRHFGIDGYFQDVSTGDQCSLGKPHPEVYLKCAKGLGVLSHNCIAVEDSINGMVSAKAARMKVLAVPEYAKLQHPAFGLADKVLPNMQSMAFSEWERLHLQ